MESIIKEKIEEYGIILKRLTEDKIELLRQWRNNPKIQQYMEYREFITPEMQKVWFNKINNANNHYFIIEVEGKEIGCINVRDVDFDKGEGEPGIFIWDDDYINSLYSFKSCIILTDFCFYDLGLKRLIIHVLKDNKRAKEFNKAFGYILSPNQENIHNQEYTLSPDNYEIKKNRIIKYLF